MVYRTIAAGAIGGAAGEIALNVVSYADMLVRVRPASELPGKVAERLAGGVGLDFARPGEPSDKATIRQEASGALLGYGMAIATALVYAVARRAGLRLPVPIAGLLLGGGAMLIADAAATALGVSDPTRWDASDWISDIVPHAAYGLVAAATIELIDE